MKQRYSRMKRIALAALTTMGIALGAQAANTDCITFSASASFGIRMNRGKDAKGQSTAPTMNLEYSTDQLNWKPFAADTGYAAVSDGGTYKLYIRGTNNTQFASGAAAKAKHIFTNTADSVATAIACSGNIMTLLDYKKVAQDEVPTMNDHAFNSLFCGFTALTTAPELPATTLAAYCYVRMFRDCTSLTAAPKLPATTLAGNCYAGIFEGCTSLTVAPKLPATTLTYSCYGSMFQACTSLTAAPKLPATTLAYGCYNNMFFGCTSLTTAPELPATTLADNCYANMFWDCKSLTDVPALDVVAVTNNCYKNMFRGCTNLMVNTLRPGKEWKIPENVQVANTATFSGKNYWATNMFANTAGDVNTGAQIVPGKTYYVGAKKAVVGDATTYSYGDQTRVEVAGELTKAVADTLKDQDITKLIIGADVTGVGDGALSYWHELRDVTIGDNVTNLAAKAFYHCTYVTNLVVGKGIAKVGADAFERNYSLTTVSFGSKEAAEACRDAFKITARITMDGETPLVDAVPEVVIDGCNKELQGKTNLTDSGWIPLDGTKPIPYGFHFFRYEYVEK